MPSEAILADTKERMEKAIEMLKKNLGGIRTGPVSLYTSDAADE